jgi:eukaryotic-like serine/threonine-protein kinase
MSQPTDPSRDLLFGLLALQNGLIDQGALFTAFAAWTRDKGRSLADHLVELGHLDAPRRAVIEAIAGLHVQALGGDIEKSLAVLAVGRSTRESLASVGGPDVTATLGDVGSAHPSTHDDDDDADRTGSISVGSATSDGQRFRIVRPHARGGLGAVFVALDSELDREVALKQILDDRADDPTSRFRFLIEAQITGGLEHPGIVPVYGLGSDGDGRPYYAMRFIRGDSLKEAIDDFHQASKSGTVPAGSRDLGLRKLLRRFMDVCNAIDYAHSRGVIHRDIKPANIIVGRHGETLVVDWGLAKPMGRVEPGTESGERLLMPSSASGSAETLPGSALGTPAYMSPEQAEGQLERLGPRSDVYSLGATLYCLLTGQPPFTGDVVDVIRAVQRGGFRPPRQLDPNLDPALEAICLKAMAHKPEDRYTTSRALADDLDRWMADEPVSAWREPLARRARRWARRNRTAVTAAAVALVAGVVGLSAVLAVQTRAKADLAASLTRETTAKTALADTNADLTRSRAAVEARYDLAVDAIRIFHTGLSEDFLLKQEQFKDVRDRLLKSASDFYGKLGALLGKETDLASRRALWQANYEVAELTAKVGTPEDALAAHRQVLAARKALAAGSPADPELNVDMGRSLTAVASLLVATGRTKEAEVTYRKAETLLVELAPTIAETAAARAVLALCRANLGWLLHTTGRDDEALSVFRLARADQEALAATPVATVESRRDLAYTINRVAILLAATGKASEAEAESRKALAIQQELAEDNPAVTEFRSRLAQSHINLGAVLSVTGNSSEAETEYRKALAIQQKLADDNRAVTEFRHELARSHHNLGNLLLNRGRSSEAETEYRKAVAIQQKLAEDNPVVTDFRNSLALSHGNLGIVLRLAGKSLEAETEDHMALALFQKLADDNPAITRFQSNLATSLGIIGWGLAQAGKTGEAIAYYTREEAMRKKLAEASSATPEDRDSLANCQTNTADLLRRAGRLVEALAACERARAVREPLVEAHPEIPDFRAGLGDTYLRLGQVRCDLENLAGAAAAWKRACAHCEGSRFLDAEHTFLLACCHAGLAGLGGRQGSGVPTTEGADQAERAMDVLRQAVTMGYRNPDAYQTESGLDPLRNRPDFRVLMMDLVMPAKPFAR